MASMAEKNQRSRWYEIEAVPDAYTFPLECRPGKLHNHVRNTFPVIDLGKMDIAKEILEASQEHGLFQVINHGISESVISQAVGVMDEFFRQPGEDKAGPPNKTSWIYLDSTDFAKDGVHLWRENVKLPCHPSHQSMQLWPDKPPRFREVVATYLEEMRKLGVRILELICEGLGLEAGYLEEISEVQLLSANKYPPCPNPSLTLGILKHRDPSLITILKQGDICGLQVLRDGQWILVEALPNALVVNIGNQLEIISNGKLRSVEHRVVTNSEKARTTIATFINPSPSCIIQPAKALVDESNPPLYQPTMYKDYVHNTEAFGPRTEALQNGASFKIS